MAEPAPQRMTLAEFLDWDDGTDRRFELIDGRPAAMTPPSEAHGTLVANLTLELARRLKPPCRVVAEAGIVLPDRPNTYYQADLAVTCAAPLPGARHVADPVVIVEVVSPSTAVHDRGLKLDDYRSLGSIKEILLVSSRERRFQLWRRAGDRWLVEDLIGEARIRLRALGITLASTAIYRNVALED